MLTEEYKAFIDRQRERNIAHIQYFLDRNLISRELELKLVRYLERYDENNFERGEISKSNIFMALVQYAARYGVGAHPDRDTLTYLCSAWTWGPYTFKLYAGKGTWYNVTKGSRSIYNTM